MAKKPAPKIKHVAWRNGRPRFEPSKTLRDLGYKGEDLKDGAGEWMTAGDAFEWSRQFQRQLLEEKAAARKRPARATPVPEAPPPPPAYPLSLLWKQWTSTTHNPAHADINSKSQYEYRRYGKTFERHLPEAWNAEAAALTKPICIGLYEELRRKIGISGSHAAMRALGTALQWAIDRGKLHGVYANPAHKLKMKKPPPRVRFATPAEIDQLIAVCDAIGRPEFGDMIILGVWSGQRQNDRLNFGIRDRSSGRLRLQQLKTKAIVSLPEAPAIKVRLDAAAARRKEAEIISPYCILNEHSWRPLTSDYYSHLFAQIRDTAAAGMEARAGIRALAPMPSLIGKAGPNEHKDGDKLLPLRDQDLRDTAVTWLAMAGATIPEICSITGHEIKSAYEILKHYLALNEHLADTAMAKMVAWYDGLETNLEEDMK